MGKLSKRKIAMCLLAASLFGKSSNSSANMGQLIKYSSAGGAIVGAAVLAVAMPAIIMSSKVDEKEAEKKWYQENKNKLQNLFNEQAKKCKIKDIQKYWDALNKIAQEDWNDIFKKAIDKRLGKNPENIKFNNITYTGIDNYKFEIYDASVDDYIDGKASALLTFDKDRIEKRESFKSALNDKTIFSDYSYVSGNFRDLQEIINGKALLNGLEIKSVPNGVEFKFKYLNEYGLEVRIYRQDYLDIKNNGDFVSIERKHNGIFDSKLELEFADLERDFGLNF